MQKTLKSRENPVWCCPPEHSPIEQSPLLTPPVYDPPPAATYLDPLETTVGWAAGLTTDQQTDALPDPIDHLNAIRTVAESFRHSGWRRTRQRVMDALHRTWQPVSRRIAFASCGSTYHVLQSKNDPTKHRLAAQACHDRFCLICGQERSRVVAHNTIKFLEQGPCRMITLTMRQTERPLTESLERLYECFKRLRAHRFWKSTQRGGVAFLEIKRSEKTNLWHPHFHVLSQGKFLDQAKLSTLWKHITGDSHIVDIRLVRDQNAAAAYVTKYASKPMDRTVLDNDQCLDEAIKALAGRRLIVTFGKWRGLRITSKPDKENWIHLTTLAELARNAVNGDADAEALLRSLCGEWSERWLWAGRVREGLERPGKPPDLDALHFVDADVIPF